MVSIWWYLVEIFDIQSWNFVFRYCTILESTLLKYFFMNIDHDIALNEFLECGMVYVVLFWTFHIRSILHTVMKANIQSYQIITIIMINCFIPHSDITHSNYWNKSFIFDISIHPSQLLVYIHYMWYSMSECDSSDHLVRRCLCKLVYFFDRSQTAVQIRFKYCVDVPWLHPYQVVATLIS